MFKFCHLGGARFCASAFYMDFAMTTIIPKNGGRKNEKPDSFSKSGPSFRFRGRK